MDNKNKIYDRFLENVITEEDMANLERDVEGASSSIYLHESFPLSIKMEKRVSDDFKKTVMELESAKLFPFKHLEQQKFLLGLKAYIEKIPAINLTFAYEPSREFTIKVVRWFFNNLQKRFLLKIKVDRSIICGLVIEYNGKYGDYSKVKAVENSLAKYHEELQ